MNDILQLIFMYQEREMSWKRLTALVTNVPVRVGHVTVNLLVEVAAIILYSQVCDAVGENEMDPLVAPVTTLLIPVPQACLKNKTIAYKQNFLKSSRHCLFNKSMRHLLVSVAVGHTGHVGHGLNVGQAVVVAHLLLLGRKMFWNRFEKNCLPLAFSKST